MLATKIDIIYELSIYDTNLTDKIKSTLNNVNYHKISITNKRLNTPVKDIIQNISNLYPELDIIPYYSLKYNQKSSAKETAISFIKLLETYQHLNIKEVLLISGVAKPRYDSLQVLELINSTYQPSKYPKIAVAYNPFLQGRELEIENQKIKAKIETAIISSVYFQIGINLDIIKESVQFIRNLQSNIHIYLSLMNPTPSRLSQFRYRPWKGVYLPVEYLQSSQKAQEINQLIYTLAEDLEIGIIQGE